MSSDFVRHPEDHQAGILGANTAGEAGENEVHVVQLREAAKQRTLEGWFVAATDGSVARPALPPIRRVGVVGAGVMGSGIAHWLTSHGFDVVMRDVEPGALARGFATVRTLFDEAVKRGKSTRGEAAIALQRLATTTTWEGFEGCDLAIEAIAENLAAKQALFNELAIVLRPDALIASNTSALPIEEIAAGVAQPERTLGIHFFNPVSRMALVELVLHVKTAPATAERALELLKTLGKFPVICRSSPGFLVTRVLFFYLNSAVHLWAQGVATEELDAAMREFGWPMGPLRLIDEVGLDVTDAIFREMEHYFPSRFTRATTCERLVAAGLNGRKNGASRGFYRYGGACEVVNDNETRPLAGAGGHEACGDERRVGIVEHLMRVMVEEARRCLDEGVVKTENDVDFALLSGTGFPAFRGGLLRWARTADG